MTALHFILIAASLVGFAVVLYRELRHDWDTLLNDGIINHREGAIRRFIWLLPSMAALVVPYFLFAEYFWKGLIIVPMLIFSLWWLLFDGFFSIHYNRNFFDIPNPKEKKNAAWTDKILYPLPIIVRAALKVGLIGLSIYFYIEPIL